MTTGTIKKVVVDRGFGFIVAEDAKEYFFHRNSLDSSMDFDRLNGGERVTFEISKPKGPRAGQARSLTAVRSRWRVTARPRTGRSHSARRAVMRTGTRSGSVSPGYRVASAKSASIA